MILLISRDWGYFAQEVNSIKLLAFSIGVIAKIYKQRIAQKAELNRSDANRLQV